MANATWPATLPPLHKAGVQRSRADNTIRDPKDGGIAKIRRQYTASAALVSTPLTFLAWQLETFDTFFTTTTLSGSLPFDWLDPVKNTTKTYRMLGYPQFRSIHGDLWQGVLHLEEAP